MNSPNRRECNNNVDRCRLASAADTLGVRLDHSGSTEMQFLLLVLLDLPLNLPLAA